MAQAEIIDLDAALPPDKQVKLAGTVYKLPGDLPVELYLRVQRAAQAIGTPEAGEEVVEEMVDILERLFRTRYPEWQLPSDVGLARLITAINQIYVAQPEPDPTPRRAGTASSKRASSRSRS